jgi:hypothetical protein
LIQATASLYGPRHRSAPTGHGVGFAQRANAGYKVQE